MGTVMRNRAACQIKDKFPHDFDKIGDGIWAVQALETIGAGEPATRAKATGALSFPICERTECCGPDATGGYPGIVAESLRGTSVSGRMKTAWS